MINTKYNLKIKLSNLKNTIKLSKSEFNFKINGIYNK